MLRFIFMIIVFMFSTLSAQNIKGNYIQAENLFNSSSQLYMLLVVSDSVTSNMIPDCKIDLKSEKGPLTGEYSGIIHLMIPDGISKLTVSAEGYVTKVITNIRNNIKGSSGVTSLGNRQYPYFLGGKTIVYSVFLNKEVTGKEPVITQPFLSDSYYYPQVDYPAEIIGGYKAIISKLDKSKLRNVKKKSEELSSIQVQVYIDQAGNVTNTFLYEGSNQEVYKEISAAIKKTKFKPAKLLGQIVRTKIILPFQLD